MAEPSHGGTDGKAMFTSLMSQMALA